MTPPSTTVASTLAEASPLTGAWDDLACELGMPLCVPSWMLHWWEENPGATLRVVAVHDGDQLIGLAPWFLSGESRRDLRLLGAGSAERIGILARPGREQAVADALATVVREQVRPDLIAFEGVAVDSDWPRRLLDALGGRRAGRVYTTTQRESFMMPLPADRDPAAWFAGRSKKFRREMTRMSNRLEQRGGSVRLIRDPEEVERGIEALRRLHDQRQRRAGRETAFTTPEMIRILTKLAGELGPDRFRLWVAEIGDTIIAAQLYLVAGRHVKFWSHGWEDDYAAIQPSKIVIRAAVEDSIARGEAEIDFGLGAYFYKSRFATVEAPVVWRGIICYNRRGLRRPWRWEGESCASSRGAASAPFPSPTANGRSRRSSGCSGDRGGRV